MKKYIFIIIAGVLLICGAFFFFTKDNGPKETELTEVQKIITKELETDYPKTPREVVKLYNRIVECYYSEETDQKDISDEELKALSKQMLQLLDEEVLLANQEEEYYNFVLDEIKVFEVNDTYIVESTVCDSNDVQYVTDPNNGDKLAYVSTSYLMNSLEKIYQKFILREDEKGKWKILYYMKGEPWNE